MSKLSLRILGGILFAAGVLIPSAEWVRLLRGSEVELSRELMQGGLLFRVGLFALGFYMTGITFLVPATSRPPRPEAARGWEDWAAIVLMAVALAIRLNRLGEGLWLDEILTFINYARLPFGENVTTYANENQHFLYSLMAHVCFSIFGENAWALRLPAVIFGVGSIGALYLLGKLVAGAREGLFAAALFAFSYHHVWFSQNARGYTGLLFWAILSSYFLLRAFDTGHRRLWVFYAVSVTLGVYTHITMAFVIVGQLVVYAWMALWKWRSEGAIRWDGFFWGYCLGGLLTYQIHSLVFPQIVSGMAKTVSVVDAWKSPLWALLEVTRGLSANFAGTFVAIGALAVFGAGLWSYARIRPAMLGLLFLPAVIGATVVLHAGHHIWPRFFFFAFGFGALVVVRGAMETGNRLAGALGPLRRVPLGTLLCGVLVLGSARSLPYAFGPKQDYGAALEYLEKQRQPGDAVVTAGLTTFTYHTLYKTNWTPVESAAQLASIRAQSNRTFVIYTLKPVLDSMFPELASALEKDFRIVKQFPSTLQNGTVTICVAGPGT